MGRKNAYGRLHPSAKPLSRRRIGKAIYKKRQLELAKAACSFEKTQDDPENSVVLDGHPQENGNDIIIVKHEIMDGTEYDVSKGHSEELLEDFQASGSLMKENNFCESNEHAENTTPDDDSKPAFTYENHSIEVLLVTRAAEPAIDSEIVRDKCDTLRCEVPLVIKSQAEDALEILRRFIYQQKYVSENNFQALNQLEKMLHAADSAM